MAKTKSTTLDPEKFNYALLKSDINEYCKKTGYTCSYISEHKLYRCKTYLSGVLNKKLLPVQMLPPILELIEKDAARYKVEVVTAPAPQPLETMKLDAVHPEQGSGWECRIKVDEDFETVMMKILKNGEEMALSRCYFFSKDNVGIIQAISYAAHQCYKSYQQTEFAQQEVNRELRAKTREICESASVPDPNDTRSFKNWILKYERELGNVGKLARYCKSVYNLMPSHGERKLRMFFQMEKEGRAHLETFNIVWPLYLKEYNAAERASNLKIIEEVD